GCMQKHRAVDIATQLATITPDELTAIAQTTQTTPKVLKEFFRTDSLIGWEIKELSNDQLTDIASSINLTPGELRSSFRTNRVSIRLAGLDQLVLSALAKLLPVKVEPSDLISFFNQQKLAQNFKQITDQQITKLAKVLKIPEGEIREYLNTL